jgi:hypothetical protein
VPKFEDLDIDLPNTPPASEAPPVVSTPPSIPNPADDLSGRLEALQAERDALKNRLETLSSGSKVQQARLDDLSARLQEMSKPAAPAAPQGPTHEQVVAAFDQRIAETEAALDEADGVDLQKARDLRRSLRQLERQYNQYNSEYRLSLLKTPDPQELVAESAKETRQQLKYEETRAKLLAEYPMLDGDSDAPDIGMIEEVYEVYQPMIRGGAEPGKALERAVKAAALSRGIKPLSAATPAAAAAEPAKPEATKPGTPRGKAAIDRNLEAAKDTPPNLGTAGESGKPGGILGKYNFGSMGIEEFMRLDSKEHAAIEEALRRYEPAE